MKHKIKNAQEENTITWELVIEDGVARLYANDEIIFSAHGDGKAWIYADDLAALGIHLLSVPE
jgi:hypothetical protein